MYSFFPTVQFPHCEIGIPVIANKLVQCRKGTYSTTFISQERRTKDYLILKKNVYIVSACFLKRDRGSICKVTQ